jgi:two-component system sensor histidine kinase UhpB
LKVPLTISLVLAAQILVAQNNVIDSLQRIVSLQRHDTTELHALLGLTNEFLRKDLQQAKKFALRVVSLADTPQEVRWLASAYNYLITVYQQSGGLDSAYYFIQLSKKVVQDHPENFRMRFNYNQAVSLFYKNTGEYKKALPYMLENLNQWKIEDENRAGQLLNLGNLFINMGEFKKATDSHLQALRLFEMIGSQRGQSYCLHSLGKSFLQLKRYNDAKIYFERSLKLKEELQDKRGIVTSGSGLGDVYKELGQFKLAEAYYHTSIKIAQEIKIPIEVSLNHHQLGLLYKRMGNIQRAKEYLNQSLKLAQELGDSTLSGKIKSELIDIDLENQQEKVTESTLLSSLTTTIRTGDRQRQAIEYSRLSEYYAQKKQYDKAFTYLKMHMELTDSVQGTLVLLQLKEMEEKYNNDKKEKEIELLKKDQELQKLELSRQQANTSIIVVALISVVLISILLINWYRVIGRSKRMIEMERMRNTIARDLHDDIGSTLSSINIMSQLALQENGNAGTHLKKIANHSAGMMEKMSDIVWSINPRNDSLKQVVIKMKEFAAEILEPKNIDYVFNIEDNILTLKLDVEKRKNIFLIFKEAVNNAAKYSEGNKLFISLLMQQDTLHLSVKDNGKGFEPTLATHGNGLKNMEDRAHSMNGKMIQASQPGTGTVIQLEVPLT